MELINKIIHLEKRLLARSEPVENLIHLIDDEFIEFSSSGAVYDKIEAGRWLAEKNSSEIKGVEFEAKCLSEEIILLAYISEIRPNPFSNAKFARRVSIWRKNKDRWQMVFHQGLSLDKKNLPTQVENKSFE
ncbi:Uncharacterized protein conserved in bacteria [Legionella wadsworthii]|uniref:Uncharacterized protein conserved in bacteria n=1 Tax=Legionella wadsworthii TaxID=28088 RepID=A0A378LW26_9GAMM|nr:DUF4440 domain-containing protein [Legionella wadsworthii]STY31150.1 Uncharacterized protein conserved in bacteria [Legionella wadsworthii]